MHGISDESNHCLTHAHTHTHTHTHTQCPVLVTSLLTVPGFRPACLHASPCTLPSGQLDQGHYSISDSTREGGKGDKQARGEKSGAAAAGASEWPLWSNLHAAGPRLHVAVDGG